MSIIRSDRAGDRGPGGTGTGSSRTRQDELREEIARSRQELAETMAALAGKAHLKRRAKAKVRRTGANAVAKARSTAGTVRNAPGSVARRAGAEVRRLGGSAKRIAASRKAPSLPRLPRADREPGE